MMFWIIAAGLTGATCLALLQALARRPADAPDHDRQFYDAEIAEIARQEQRRLIGAAEAEAARTEAARRLLAGSRGGAASVAVQTVSMAPRRLGAVLVLAIVPIVGGGVYLLRGSPELPSLPLASRAPDPGTQVAAGDLGTMVKQIEAHLARTPDDGRGHDVVAPVYLRLDRPKDAARSYGEAIRLLGATPARLAGLGEALVFAAEGTVTTQARLAFEQAVEADPKNAKARFFLALGAEQSGNRAEAAARLTALHDDLPDGGLKTEIAAQLRAMGAPVGAAAASGAAIAALPEAERIGAVRQMVEGLAERLASTGGSAAEWARLIRALTVLGEGERAAAILAEARQKFAADPDGLRSIEQAALPGVTGQERQP